MTEYIERDMLYRVLERCRKAPKNRYQRGVEDGMELALNAVKAIHTADVAPVVHGRWEGWITPAFYGLDDFGEPIYRDAAFYRCSICSRKSAIKEKFCPSCGAMMD